MTIFQNSGIERQASPLIIIKDENQSRFLVGNDCVIKSQVPLASLTSFRVGGAAQWYVAPRNLEELQATIEWAKAQELGVMFLGAGSNLLVSDRGIPGLVIGTRHLRFAEFNAQTGEVRAAAGEPLPHLAWQAAKRGWQGLEWAVGIPGSVGGAVVMNAGAHKSCVADMLVNTQIISALGELQTLTPSQLGYKYRTSILQGSAHIVTEATLQLQPGADPEHVLATTSQHLEQRRTTQPYHLPSCGSVFRNPKPYTAGWLIEQTGLKGYRIGGAQVSERHANFILNCGGAKASDIYALINYIQAQVEQRWSILLQPEVKIIGEFN